VYNTNCDRLCNILAEEGLALLPNVIESKVVKTPTGDTYDGLEVPDVKKHLCAVSIVRSGDILLEAVRRVAVGVAVGKILLQRDEEDEHKRPKLYYSKLPKDVSERTIMLVDPMLATGGSANLAIKVLLDAGVKEKNILFLVVVAAPEGIENVHAKHPDVRIVAAEIDKGLNEDKYIVPGLGDFGDRYYGTED
jgi:uracil phosphoribosyltransferase